MSRHTIRGRRRILGSVLALAALLVGVLSAPASAPAVSAAGAPLGSPSGLPSHFGIGLSAAPNTNGIYGWMPNSGTPWDYAYQYLSGGVNTGTGWETWNPSGQFALYYAQGAASHGYIPVFPYYEMLESNGSCNSCIDAQKDFSNLNNASTMAAYFQNFTLLMKRLSAGTYNGITGFGKTAIVHIEPDLSGYAEVGVLNNAKCYGYCTGQGNNPAFLRASVAASGDPDVASYPNTYQGFNWALLHLRDLYAPNVLLAFHVSDWATGQDIGSSSDPNLNASALGQEAGSFASQSGISGVPAGASTYDLLFNDVLDRDAAYYKYVLHDPSHWWDRYNSTFPNFHRWETYISAASGAASRSVIVWQVPEGNQYFDTENNTSGHYQDNRAEYFFSHIPELVQSGVIGMMFGAGNSGSTVHWDGNGDGVTNPPSFCTTDGSSGGQICNTHPSSVSDDDGGYLRTQGQQYYANGGYPLGGGNPTPTLAPSPSPTPTSPGGSLVLGNFEGTTEGWAGNSDVSNDGPSTYPPPVALGQYSLWLQYAIPKPWSEVQLSKAVNVDLSRDSTLSVSVYAKQPVVPTTGVQVRFLAQGSDGKWYASLYQRAPIGSRTTVTWNIAGVPRQPLKQLFVTWQYTTSAVGYGNEIFLDAIQAY